MKAWMLEVQRPIEKRPLKFTEIPTPIPKGDEIRIKINYCGICRTDLHIIEGDLPLKKKPIIPGHEIIGVVDKLGDKVKRFKIGDVVGVSWLNSTCGKCKYCLSGRENYCPYIKLTGWDVDGGYAEYTVIREKFAFDLNFMKMEKADIAPLMCPGISGYTAFKLTEVTKGDKLGLIGFGPTAYYILKVAKYFNTKTFVSTRSKEHKEIAKKAGANWVGNIIEEDFPEKLDAIILFPPVGDLVEKALSQLTRAGVLVLSAVSMSEIKIRNYSKNLWGRQIKTLYNVKLSDGNEFLKIANNLNLTIKKSIFKFEELQDALISFKRGKIKGLVGVVKISD